VTWLITTSIRIACTHHSAYMMWCSTGCCHILWTRDSTFGMAVPAWQMYMLSVVCHTVQFLALYTLLCTPLNYHLSSCLHAFPYTNLPTTVRSTVTAKQTVLLLCPPWYCIAPLVSPTGCELITSNSMQIKLMSCGARPPVEHPTSRLTLLILPTLTFHKSQWCVISGPSQTLTLA
jgi:hypothetical protein